MVDPRDRLIVLSQLGAAFWRIWQVRRDDHVFGFVVDFVHAVVGLVVPKIIRGVGEIIRKTATAVRIGRAKVKKERLLRIFFDKGARDLSHGDRVAGASLIAFEVSVKMINWLRLHVVLSH